MSNLSEKTSESRSADDTLTFDAIRARFPGATESVYLNVASCGLLSTDTYQAITTHIRELRDGYVDKPSYFAAIGRVREKFATLINAGADEIAFTKNASDGLNMIAGAFDWKPGDNIVLCTELEHPNNVYPWLNVRDRYGVTIRTVPQNAGEIDVQRMADTIDNRTRLVAASSVTFSPGNRTDIETLGSVCRERGAYLMVDAAQSVGVIHTDVRGMKIDGLAVATQKALLGLYGMGFLYCRREWAESLRPAALARFSVDFGEDMHEASTGTNAEYRLMPAARRFDIGNYNYAATHALEPSLDLLLAVGSKKIDRYVSGLAAHFAHGLKDTGVPVSSGVPGSTLSHIVTAGTYDQDVHETASHPATESLAKYLRTNRVVCCVRRGMIRFSLHMYNNKADVNRVLELIRQWQSQYKGARWSE
ncbi:Cysteine desulfurase [uncultured Woeseiaceae bacterium]|uniref:Cysteine desulfurase n=1 Tax=uncultured Woeseiaceae bacterium TaxID=1983305 RepID=A0A7D9H4X1_9GAMM|nr:Cysteine desulfurase [uncultured Woeseiaceae bacterium]